MRRLLQVCGLLLLFGMRANAQVVFASGFETGDFSEWNPGCQQTCAVDHAYAHSGNYGVKLTYKLCGNPIIDPATFATQTAGGSLSSRTYYVTYTNTNATGETGRATNDNETQASDYQATKAVSANNYFKFTTPPAHYQMTGYHVYVGTVSGTLYRQTVTGPVTLGTDWTEPSSCPGGHTCISGTNLVNDTAAPPGHNTNTAGCGSDHDDKDSTVRAFLPNLYPGHEHDNGLTHFWIRGYVKFITPTAGEGGQWMQRKMVYLMAKYRPPSECGNIDRCWQVAPGGPPSSRYRFWLAGGCGFAGYRCDAGHVGEHWTNWAYSWVHYLDVDHWAFDTWYLVEWEIKTRSTATTCDGIERMWVDGVNLFDDTTMCCGGDYFADGITRFMVGDQVDRFKYRPIYEDRWWDDVRIFSGNTGATPSNTCSTLYSGDVPCIGPLPASSPGAQIAPLSISFTDADVGHTVGPEVITLTNNGGDTLHISDISITGAHAADFSKTTTCGATLAVDASCTVSASFTPLALGLHTAAVTFTDDGPGSPQSVSLSGTSVTPPAGAVNLSPGLLGFDSRTVGTTSDAQTVTLRNTGEGTLNINGIVATTTSAPTTGDFTIESITCGATLAPAGTCAVNITFRPRVGGSRTGNLRFTTDAGSSPDDVALSGIGQTRAVVRKFTGHLSKN